MSKVLVLGATSAIGAEVSKIYAESGAAMFLVARDPKKLEAVKADLLTRGASKVEIMSLDLAEVAEHRNLISQAEQALSGLDTVLVFYGTLGDQGKCEQSVDETLAQLRTNLLSVVSILTLCANRLQEKGNGVIAVVSSVAGDRGRQSNYVYGTAKGGLSIFLQGLRNRLFKSGVHVLDVKPGFVDTPMTSGLKKNFLFASPQTVAIGIDRAIKARRNTVYLPWFWRFIMTIIKLVPESIFKRLKL